jgi:hypothetical protein
VETLDDIVTLPLFKPIYEDEIHVFRDCPHYENLINSLNDRGKECQADYVTRLFTERSLSRDTANLLIYLEYSDSASHRRTTQKLVMPNGFYIFVKLYLAAF